MGGLGVDGGECDMSTLREWTFRHEEILIRVTGLLWIAAAIGYSVLRSVNG